jgi:pimeloyl-ACP methyl ester carboxylesterase
MRLPSGWREGVQGCDAEQLEVADVSRDDGQVMDEGGCGSHAVLQQVVAKLPRARLTMHPEDGHSPFIESPERFNQELSDFLQALPKP